MTDERLRQYTKSLREVADAIEHYAGEVRRMADEIETQLILEGVPEQPPLAWSNVQRPSC